MYSKICCLVMVIFALAELSTATPPDQFVKKYISLSEITPQGILHLPPTSHFDETPAMCDFWVSFFSDLPEAALPHHKAFGISIVPSRLELAEGDSIDFLAHPLYADGESPHSISQSHGEKTSWDSSKNLATENLEFKPSLGWQDICINMTGKWNEKKSKATLVITLYFDQEEAEYHSEACPEGMSVCECSQSKNRCIYTDLLCNGVTNCGAICEHDESTCSSNAGGASGGQQGSESGTTIQNCEWSNFEYLMMISMSGLLLILIPAIFLLTMMYHRRSMAMRRSPASFDGNNNRSSQYPHVITVTPIHDHPPTYNEIPHNVKVESRN